MVSRSARRCALSSMTAMMVAATTKETPTWRHNSLQTLWPAAASSCCCQKQKEASPRQMKSEKMSDSPPDSGSFSSCGVEDWLIAGPPKAPELSGPVSYHTKSLSRPVRSPRFLHALQLADRRVEVVGDQALDQAAQ